MAGSAGAQEAPKNRYEKLENRISSYMAVLVPLTTSHSFQSSDELEAMLKDQNAPPVTNSSKPNLSPSSAHSQSPSLPVYHGLSSSSISTPPSSFHSPDLALPQSYQPSSVTFTGIAPSSKSFISPVDAQPEVINISSVTLEAQDTTSFLTHGFGYDVFWPGWSRDLPSPGLVRHL